MRLASVLIGAVALVFGVAYGRELPGAPIIAGASATASAWLGASPSRLIAALTLALAVTALTFAGHWTLDERVIGSHVALGACTVVWIAQQCGFDSYPLLTPTQTPPLNVLVLGHGDRP